jgi:acyl-homoserine lactone acylase PvdQ
VLDAQPTRTRLRVSYDLTALSADGARWLEAFADGFNRYIAHWETAIAATLPDHHPGQTPSR